MLLANSCRQIVGEPTRISPTAETLIDLIITNDNNFKARVEGSLNISDHETIVFTRDINVLQSKDKFNMVEILKYDKNEFIHNLKVDDLHSVLGLDVDQLASQFQSRVDHATQQLITTTKEKYTNNEWFNNELRNLKQVKIRKRQRALLTNNELDWINFRVIRNVYRRKLEQARNVQLFRSTVQLFNCSDQKKMWRTLKTIVTKKSKDSIDYLYFENGVKVEGNQALANELNEFFIRSIKQIQTEIDIVPFSDMVSEVETRFSFRNITLLDLQNIIDNLNNKRDCKLVNKTMITDVFPKIYLLLLKIINNSLNYGVFPEIWKESIITPIAKIKGSKKCEEYRPINSMVICEKILEKVVQQQLEDYLENNNLLIENQSGFRRNHSCESAINLVVNIWKEQGAIKKTIICVFLDLKRAFETIDRKILLKKLEKYGIRGVELKWFKCYLTNRSQRTKVNDKLSEPQLSEFGVPQGSILGALLFILYINDLQNVIKSCTLSLFADDALLFISADDPKAGALAMQADLDRISSWMKSNRLKLNVNKTKCMVLLNDFNIELFIDNCQIEQVKEIKYLGVIIDYKLKFSAHVRYICNKLSKKIGFLKRIRKSLTKSTAINVYNVIIKPHFEYCCTILYLTNQDDKYMLQKMQNRAMRVLLMCDRYTSISYMLRELNWLNIDQSIKCNVLVYIFKIKCNLLPNYLMRHIEFVGECVPYNLRMNDMFRLPNFRDARSQNSLIYSGFKLFNELPSQIRAADNLIIFKKTLVEYLKMN